MKLGRLASFVVVLITCSFLSASASAQTPEEAAAAGTAWLISTSSTGLTTTVGGIILTVVLVNSGKKSAMMWYIRQNSVALRQEVTMGGGDTVADVGEIFGVAPEHYEAFANAVQTQRRQLVALIGTDPIDEARTEQFIETLWEAVATDDELAAVLAEQYVVGG